MKSFEVRTKQTSRLLIVGTVAFGLTCAVAAHADSKDDIVVPPVPTNLEVPAGNRVYLAGHAIGTQDYICLPSGWVFYGPQATLFDVEAGDDEQIITHFLSPNPAEGGKPRPTWQHSRDTSAVWGNNDAGSVQSSTDPAFVAAGAIPWLRLEVAGTQSGPTGGDKLTNTTFIQRLNTSGGVAPPAADCTSVGQKALVTYSADYFFYKAAKGGADEAN